MVTISPVTLKKSYASPSKTETFAKDTAAVEKFPKISEELVKMVSVEPSRTENRKHHHVSLEISNIDLDDPLADEHSAHVLLQEESSKALAIVTGRDTTEKVFLERAVSNPQSSFQIPGEEENVGAQAEIPERHTSLRLSSQTYYVSGNSFKSLLR